MRLWHHIAELRHRPLWQVLAVYFVGGAVAYQMVQSLTEGLGLPWWIPPVAVAVFIAGIPVAVAFSVVMQREQEARRRMGKHKATEGEADETAPTEGLPAGAKLSRIVVLPFENLGEPDRAYIARGITEEITARLAQIRALGVISHNTAIAYGGGKMTTREIGAELDVAHVLEGSVLVEPSGDGGLPGRIRVIPQLIRVADDTHVWSHRFDIDLTDLFHVQSSIAENIARALDLTLLEPDRKALATTMTDDLEAYDHYLRGNEAYGHRFSEAMCREAARHYELALKCDPKFAEAHAALARALVWLHSQFGRTDELARARSAVDEALRLDPELIEGHTALGDYYYYGKRDFDRADREYAWVTERQPGHSDALALHALTMRRRGLWEQSLSNLAEALELDPRNTVWMEGQGQTYFSLGRFDEALRWLRRAVEVAPHVAYYHLWLMWATLLDEGDVDHGRAILRRAEERSPLGALLTDQEASWLVMNLYGREFEAALATLTEDDPGVDPALLWLARGEAARQAKRPEAEAMYEKALKRMAAQVQRAESILAPHHHLAYIHARLGQREPALRAGEHAMKLLPMSTDQIDGAHRRLHFARTLLVLGEHDRAAEIVEALMRVPILVTRALLDADPFWAPIRGDDRLRQPLRLRA